MLWFIKDRAGGGAQNSLLVRRDYSNLRKGPHQVAKRTRNDRGGVGRQNWGGQINSIEKMYQKKTRRLQKRAEEKKEEMKKKDKGGPPV